MADHQGCEHQDGVGGVIASVSEAIQTFSAVADWIASSLSLLAMTKALSTVIPGRCEASSYGAQLRT